MIIKQHLSSLERLREDVFDGAKMGTTCLDSLLFFQKSGASADPCVLIFLWLGVHIAGHSAEVPPNDQVGIIVTCSLRFLAFRLLHI